VIHLLAALLFHLPALARSSPVSCPTAAQMEPFIYMCGENRYVAIQAQICAQEAADTWNAAAQKLLPILQAQESPNAQDHSEENARRSYVDTVNALSAQITLMQKYADIIEQYPRAMIDLPNSTGDATSLSCFNEAFHQVGDVLKFMDDEIIRAKHIREAATKLMIASNSRRGSFESIRDASMVSGKNFGGGPFRADESSITGEIQNALLTSKAAAKRLGPADAPRPFVAAPGSAGDQKGILASFNHNLMEGLRPETPSNGNAQGKADSVGSLVFSDKEGDVSVNRDMKALLDKPAPGRVVYKPVPFKVAALVGPSGKVQGFAEAPAEEKDSAPSVELRKDGTSPLPLSPIPVSIQKFRGANVANPARSIASADQDLFHLVSDRYRATELFRRARVSNVPLDGFDSRLKK
jgi:hypothetical protein